MVWFLLTLYFNELLDISGDFHNSDRTILCRFRGRSMKIWALSFFVVVVVVVCVFIAQWLSQFSRTSGSFPLSLFLFLSPHLCRACFSPLPLSFLLSHLVTRPLERSVKFPLSQRRGQSEPHKDPQWTPLCSLSSLPAVAAAAHMHSQAELYKGTLPCLFSFVLFLFFLLLLPYNSSALRWRHVEQLLPIHVRRKVFLFSSYWRRIPLNAGPCFRLCVQTLRGSCSFRSFFFFFLFCDYLCPVSPKMFWNPAAPDGKSCFIKPELCCKQDRVKKKKKKLS